MWTVAVGRARNADERPYDLEKIKKKPTTAGSYTCFMAVHVEYYLSSLTVLDLTLVDLPGLTKNPVGDQDPGIVHKVCAPSR